MTSAECYKIAYDVQNKQKNYRLAAVLYQTIVTHFPEELHCRYSLDRLAELQKMGYTADMEDRRLRQAAEQLFGGQIVDPERFFDDLARKERGEKEEELLEQGIHQYYEYKAISIADAEGRCDVASMNKRMNELSMDGWRLHSALTNKTGIDYSGRYTSAESNEDETVLIFERLIHLE